MNYLGKTKTIRSMKKYLLLFACTFAVSMAYAQRGNDVKVVNHEDVIEYEVPSVVEQTEADEAEGVQRSFADGVYYRTPVGSLWKISSRPSYTYSVPYHVVAPLMDFALQNMSLKKDGHWAVTTASSVIDYDKYADEENNLVYSYPGGAANYYAPAYTESEITYIPTKKTSTMRNSVAGLDYISFFPTSLDNVTFSGGGSLLPLKNL